MLDLFSPTNSFLSLWEVLFFSSLLFYSFDFFSNLLFCCFFCCCFVWLIFISSFKFVWFFFLLPRPSPFALHSTDGRVDEQIETFEFVTFLRRRRRRCHVIVGCEFEVAGVAAIARAVGGFHVDGRPRITRTGRWWLAFDARLRLHFFVVVLLFVLLVVFVFSDVVLVVVVVVFCCAAAALLLLLLSKPARYFA